MSGKGRFGVRAFSGQASNNDLLRKQRVYILTLVEYRREAVVCIYIWRNFFEDRLGRHVSKDACYKQDYIRLGHNVEESIN